MATRKIYDINPPEETAKEAVKPALYRKPKKKGHLPRNILLLLGGALILAWGAAFFLIEPRAVITIWPETEAAEFPTSAQIPNSTVEAEYVVSQEFPATGIKSKASKASGTITVYNAYSEAPQALIATTRFVSNDGKLFRTPARVVVPGGRNEGGKLVPGTVDIVVEADQPGEEYNIGQATFSIPGFAGTAKYTAFYAKSFSPMTGGAKTEVAEVTENDLKNAQELLEEKALAESEKKLLSSVASRDDVIIKENIVSKIVEVLPFAEKGQEASSFILQVKARAQAPVFKKSDMLAFAQDYIASRIPGEKAVQSSSLTFSYLADSLSLLADEIKLDVILSAGLYSLPDEAGLKQAFGGRKIKELNGLIRDLPGVAKVEVELQPFWAMKLPRDASKIEIRLNLD